MTVRLSFTFFLTTEINIKSYIRKIPRLSSRQSREVK
nr:MAG TPA: hypothetical protein [Crassvirales sp.]